MLIAQGPLRVSLFGGGSDLPAFLQDNDGAVLSFAINRCVYVVGHPFTHRTGIVLKYSETEDVQESSLLRHPIARVVLEKYGVSDIDISVMSDVPAGTGMGSSSSFTVAFLAFVRELCGVPTSSVDLAREACEIEIDVLNEPIGLQDQWASALGGVNVFRFSGSSVKIEPVPLVASQLRKLETNIRLIPVGGSRSASVLLENQSKGLTSGSASEAITRRMVTLVDYGVKALTENLDELGPLLDEAWSLKREISAQISSALVDTTYETATAAGATGGKLLGAGASGYLACYVPEASQEQFNAQFPNQLDFRISEEGAGIVHRS